MLKAIPCPAAHPHIGTLGSTPPLPGFDSAGKLFMYSSFELEPDFLTRMFPSNSFPPSNTSTTHYLFISPLSSLYPAYKASAK